MKKTTIPLIVVGIIILIHTMALFIYLSNTLHEKCTCTSHKNEQSVHKNQQLLKESEENTYHTSNLPKKPILVLENAPDLQKMQEGYNQIVGSYPSEMHQTLRISEKCADQLLTI